MSIFEGSAVALVTPFTENGVNFDELKKLLDFHIQNGTDAIVVCGTTGEPSTMTAEEKHAVIETSVKHVAGRVPVIAGSGGNNTAAAIEESKFCEGAGADALLVVTPYYNKCSQHGLARHYLAIADAVNIPMILYNVPARTGVNIQPGTLDQIADHKNIAAVKEASGNISQIAEVARLTKGRMDLYSGNDDQIVPLLSLGGKGVISVLANVDVYKRQPLRLSFPPEPPAKHEAHRSRLHSVAPALPPPSSGALLHPSPLPVQTEKPGCFLAFFDFATPAEPGKA